MRRIPFWPQKIEARNFPANFCTQNFLGRGEPLCRHSTNCCFVAGHTVITRFRPWSPIALDRKSFRHDERIPNVVRTTCTVEDFEPHSGISGPTSRRSSACPNLHEWCTQPAHVRCSAVDISEIPWFYKITSWICTIISGLVIVLARPERGASQVETSTRLYWVAYDVACSPYVFVRMAWISFRALPCRIKTLWQFVSGCCWNRARHLICFLSASVRRKYLQIGTWTDPSFQQHYPFRSTTSGSRLVRDISTPPRE